MDAKGTSLGSSITVPCVQELAKGVLTTIPHRYVCPDQEPTTIPRPSLSLEIPVINFQNLLSEESHRSELGKLHSACKEWGFFQLTNHGISSKLMEKVKQETKDFFGLPIEEKKNFWQEPGDLQGFGQHFVMSEDQRLDWADLFYVVTLPTLLRKPSLFSKLPISFRETIVLYSEEVKTIAMALLDLMAKALEIDKPEEIRGLFEEGMQAMRMNYYPPCPQPDLVMGLTAHSDATGLTILLQLNDVEGLQIKKNGMWVPVKPLPDAFIINIGDSLEIVTNGNYKSIEHRAVVNSEKERLSIATFHSPNIDGVLGPAPSLITTETPALFKSLGVAEYYKRFLGRKLHEKSNLDDLRIVKENGNGAHD